MDSLLTIMAAAVAVAFPCMGAGLGIGRAAASAVEAVARQPEADSKVTKNLLLGCALAEATAIYGFVIALIILMVKG